MWQTITFPLSEKTKAYQWAKDNASLYRIQEIAVNNGIGFTFKPLVTL